MSDSVSNRYSSAGVLDKTGTSLNGSSAASPSAKAPPSCVVGESGSYLSACNSSSDASSCDLLYF